MRTLASTFNSRGQAEAAIERLEAIGIPRERIILKVVERAAGAPAPPGSAGAAFLSVKVTTDQVQAVSDILKAQSAVEDKVAAADTSSGRNGPQVAAAPPSRPLPASDASGLRPQREEAPAQREEAPAQHRPAQRKGAGDRARLGRYLIFYGLALVAAFMIGAWLGLLS